jgi:hypothetical protein
MMNWHSVFSIPKILRRCFLYDRERLTDLSRCDWESLKAYFTSCSKHSDALPGAVIAIQTFGDLLGYHPHLHVLISDGCFHKSGLLTVAPAIDTHALEQLFRHKILKLLLSEGRITKGKDGRPQKSFDALEWLAVMPACACRTQTGVRTCPIRPAPYLIRGRADGALLRLL